MNPPPISTPTGPINPQVQSAGRLPNTEAVASLDRDERRSATEIAKYHKEQLDKGLDMRRPHAIRWMQVLSILNGIHYFKIDSFGFWRPMLKDPRRTWAVVPLMEPYYRWEHGRLSSNQIGCTATPSTGQGNQAFYKTKIAQDVMNYWIDETSVSAVDDESNQQLLIFGGHVLFNEKVPWKQQTFARSWAFSELFPIPYDARTWEEMDGVARVATMSKEWLAMQDEMYERRYGTKPPRKMADKTSARSMDMNSRFTGFSSAIQWGGRLDGATCAWIWRKATPINPYGEYMFMVEDELFGYVSGRDERGRMIALQDGEIPLKPVYYIKKPNDWWPTAFCSGLISPQLELNRQMSRVIESANINRGFLGYNSQLIRTTDIQESVTGLVPFNPPGIEERVPPLVPVPAANVGKDVGAVMTLVNDFAKRAAAYESDIVMGQAEGRVEGGPATSLLNSNAQAPIQPVMDRKHRAYKQLFRNVYEDIREVWPPQKMIIAAGPEGLARQILVSRNELPDSHEVILSPTPQIVNGRNMFASLLMQLRAMPSDDGKPVIKSSELRRGLQMLNMAPPGLTIFDPTEQRIRWRIGQLINDGAQPAIRPAMDQINDPQVMENHMLAMELLKEAILDPAFSLYSPMVKKALMAELDFHRALTGNIRHPDAFDNDPEVHEARQADNMLEAAENNPETLEGIFAPGGLPLTG